MRSAALVGSSGLAALGLPVGRELELVVANEGREPVTDPPFTLAQGSDDAPTDAVDTPTLGALRPREERTYRVPVGRAFWGEHTVRGEIAGLDVPATVSASTTVRPWWIALLAVAVAAAWASRRSRRGRRVGTPPRSAPREAVPVR